MFKETIESAWLGYRITVIPEITTELSLKVLKDTFYAGALASFTFGLKDENRNIIGQELNEFMKSKGMQ